MTAVIAGAGLAGLSCALALRGRARLFERDGRPGGLCRTERLDGFTIDHTGHYLHFKDEAMRRLVEDLLQGNLHGVERNSWVRLNGRLTPYPFQANTCGHPPAVVRDCVVGFCRALEEASPGRRGESYAAWIRRTYGEGFLRWFMRPFNEKQFHARLEDLLPLQGGRFLPRPDVAAIVRGALRSHRARIGYNAALWHPRTGGIEALPRALAGALPSPPETNRPLRRVRWRERLAEFDGAGAVPYGVLVSTLPLPTLLDALDPLPAPLARVRRALRWIGVLCLHYCIRRPPETRRHWVYVPDRRISFYRYGFPANVNPADAPRGSGIVSAEVSYVPGRRPDPARALARARRELLAVGAIGHRDDIVHELAIDFPVGYVVFDRAYPAARSAALRFLARNGILSIGRYGGWVYGGMEDALIEGRDTGRLIAAYGERAARVHPVARA
jgi:protoporphyrinogen oxidase